MKPFCLSRLHQLLAPFTLLSLLIPKPHHGQPLSETTDPVVCPTYPSWYLSVLIWIENTYHYIHNVFFHFLSKLNIQVGLNYHCSKIEWFVVSFEIFLKRWKYKTMNKNSIFPWTKFCSFTFYFMFNPSSLLAKHTQACTHLKGEGGQALMMLLNNKSSKWFFSKQGKVIWLPIPSHIH